LFITQLDQCATQTSLPYPETLSTSFASYPEYTPLQVLRLVARYPGQDRISCGIDFGHTAMMVLGWQCPDEHERNSEFHTEASIITTRSFAFQDGQPRLPLQSGMLLRFYMCCLKSVSPLLAWITG
jgi:hypothetical protein